MRCWCMGSLCYFHLHPARVLWRCKETHLIPTVCIRIHTFSPFSSNISARTHTLRVSLFKGFLFHPSWSESIYDSRYGAQVCSHVFLLDTSRHGESNLRGHSMYKREKIGRTDKWSLFACLSACLLLYITANGISFKVDIDRLFLPVARVYTVDDNVLIFSISELQHQNINSFWFFFLFLFHSK